MFVTVKASHAVWSATGGTRPRSHSILEPRWPSLKMTLQLDALFKTYQCSQYHYYLPQLILIQSRKMPIHSTLPVLIEWYYYHGYVRRLNPCSHQAYRRPAEGVGHFFPFTHFLCCDVKLIMDHGCSFQQGYIEHTIVGGLLWSFPKPMIMKSRFINSSPGLQAIMDHACWGWCHHSWAFNSQIIPPVVHIKRFAVR